MFVPKYRILLMSTCFPQDKAVCLGSQLISIVNNIKGLLPQHMWYGADIVAVGKGSKKNSFNEIQLKIIGTDSELIEFCSEIEQFIWGEFVCMDSKLTFQDMQDIKLETEDAPFRPINCSGILIEIRTFDTTFFEIYSQDIELIKKIAIMYEIDIDSSENNSNGRKDPPTQDK